MGPARCSLRLAPSRPIQHWLASCPSSKRRRVAGPPRRGRARVVVFDKTGTLTLGRPWVADVVPLGGASPAEVVRLAAAVEQHSEHPLARAVVARALHDGLVFPDADQFTALVGRGAKASVGGQTLAVGNGRL